MKATEFIQQGLNGARRYTEALIEKFATPEEWVAQPYPGANHALWCIGHIAGTDNMCLSILAPEKAREMKGYKELFGGGSTPQADVSAYPPVEEVLAYFRERRETLLEVFAGLTDDDLDRETPEGAPDFLPTVGAVFNIAIWHEGLHAGQASIAHRSLGKPPVMG